MKTEASTQRAHSYSHKQFVAEISLFLSSEEPQHTTVRSLASVNGRWSKSRSPPLQIANLEGEHDTVGASPAVLHVIQVYSSNGRVRLARPFAQS